MNPTENRGSNPSVAPSRSCASSTGSVKGLSKAEKMLLESFVSVLRDEPNAHERFDTICDLIQSLTAAAKATVKLRSLSQNEKLTHD